MIFSSQTRILNTGLVLILSLSLGIAGCSNNKGPIDNNHQPEPKEKMEPDLKRSAEINTQLGLTYLQRGEKYVAAEKLGRALRDDPDSALVQHGNAILYDSLGQTTIAQEHFRRAIEITPNDSEVLNNYGAFLCRQGQFSEGEAMLHRALTNPLYQTPGFAWANIGQCQRQNQQLAEAETSFKQALQLNPRQAYAWLQLASLQLEKNQALQANSSLQRFHAIEPQNPASLLLGAKIEKALGHREAQAHYELLLRGKFPDSDEAHSLGESN